MTKETVTRYAVWLKLPRDDEWDLTDLIFDSEERARRHIEGMPDYFLKNRKPREAEAWRNAQIRIEEVKIPIPQDAPQAGEGGVA